MATIPINRDYYCKLPTNGISDGYLIDFTGPPLLLYRYSDLYDSPSESQSFGTIFFRFIWEKTKKDVVLCRQNTVQWCNGSTTDSGPVCPSSNLGWTTLKTWRKVRFYFYSSPDYFNIRVSIRNTYRSSILSNNSKDKFSAICDLYSKKYKKEKNKRKITVRQSCCCVCTNKGCMSVWIISYCDAPCGF